MYLPRTTPRQKRERIAAIGGTWIHVAVEGDTYDAAAAAAAEDVARTGAQRVPAFDDPRTIAGQGTVAREIVEQLGRAPDRLIVAVGGGGLLAGMATWLGERHPGVALTGVEPEGAASMSAALAAGQPVTLADLDAFVDGAAVRTAGTATFPIVRASGAKLVTVEPGAVCTEMLALYQTDGKPRDASASYWYWVAADNPQVHLGSAAAPLTVDMDEAKVLAAVDVALDAVWYDHLRDVPDLYE